MVAMARAEALNSTGSVTSWKSVVKENSTMPMKKRDWLYNTSPTSNRMKDRLEPIRVAGIMAVRSRTGP